MTINWENILTNDRRQFYKSINASATGPAAPVCSSSTPVADLNNCTDGRSTEVFDLPYDPDSIMHYGYREYEYHFLQKSCPDASSDDDLIIQKIIVIQCWNDNENVKKSIIRPTLSVYLWLILLHIRLIMPNVGFFLQFQNPMIEMPWSDNIGLYQQ